MTDTTHQILPGSIPAVAEPAAEIAADAARLREALAGGARVVVRGGSSERLALAAAVAIDDREPICWVTVEAFASFEATMLALGTACGMPAAGQLRAAAWYDDVGLRRVVAGIQEALLARGALLVLELGDGSVIDGADERWRHFLLPIARAVRALILTTAAAESWNEGVPAVELAGGAFEPPEVSELSGQALSVLAAQLVWGDAPEAWTWLAADGAVPVARWQGVHVAPSAGGSAWIGAALRAAVTAAFAGAADRAQRIAALRTRLEGELLAGAGDPTHLMARLTRFVRLAIGAGEPDLAAELLTAPEAELIRDRCPALVERLAAELARSGDLDSLRAVALANLRATYWYEVGNLDAAVGLFRAALEVTRRIDQPRVLLHALSNLGNALSSVDPAAAEACFAESIELAGRLGQVPEELIALNNLALTLLEAGETERAGDCFDRAIRRVDETGSWDTFGNIIVGNLGLLYEREDDRSMATLFLRRAMESSSRTGDTEIWAFWLTRLTALLSRGDHPVDEMVRCAEELYQARQTSQRPGAAAEAAWLLGFAYLRQGRTDDAGRLALDSADLSEASGQLRLAIESLELAAIAGVDGALPRRERLLDAVGEDREVAARRLTELRRAGGPS